MIDANIAFLFLPKPFTRERFCAHLYAPYSRKIRRRVYLYTHSGYSLWTQLESDPDVATFNERVASISIPIGNMRVKNYSPEMVTASHSGEVTVHTIDEGQLEKSSTSPDWSAWALNNGCRHTLWGRQILHEAQPYLANLAQLLRYVCQAGAIPNAHLESALLAQLKAYKKRHVSIF